MRTDLFDFELPSDNIALRPASPRDSARLLVVPGDGGLQDRTVADLPLLLELKEKTGPDAPGAEAQLAAARKAWDRFEEEWEG